MQGLYSGGFQVSNTGQLPQLETKESFVAWLSEQLKSFVGVDNADELVAYVIGIDDEDELKTYFLSLLGEGKKYNKFMDVLLKKKKSVGSFRKAEVPENAKVYVKSKEEEELNKKKKATNSTPKKKETQTQMEIVHGVKVKVTKSKQKVDQIVVPGRHICDCQATEHALVGNCLNCGKIICAQEGTGPCLFCSSDAQNSSASNESLEKAIKHKDQLLEYDRTSAQRTVVYDDQADYFTSMNQWVTPEERERMEKQFEEERRKKEEDRFKNRITFDFAGRKIVVGEGQKDAQISKQNSNSNVPSKESKNAPSNSKNAALHPLVNPNIDVPAPKFTKKNVYAKNKKQKSEHQDVKSSHRIQHEYYEAIGGEEDLMEATPIISDQSSEAPKPVPIIPEKKSPFKWRGIVQDVPRTDREKELLIELMERKKMNFYLLFLDSKNWREKIATEVLQNVAAFAKTLQAKKITTNIGVTIGNDFDFTSKQDLAIVAQTIQSITSLGFRGAVIRLDKNLISLTDANKKVFKSIGEAHCSMVSELLKQLGGKVVLNVAPPLEISLDSPISKFQADYFQSVSQNMPDNVGFILHGNWKSIYLPNAEKIKVLFKGRRVIVIDSFPPSQQDLVFLQPYDKRDAGIDKYMEGIAINPPVKNLSAALIGLSTAFDFLQHPPTYDADLSLRSALSKYVEDQRLADELFEIVHSAPGTDATSTFVLKSMPSKQSILELQERLKVVKKSITSEKLGPNIFPFLQFMDSFCNAMISK